MSDMAPRLTLDSVLSAFTPALFDLAACRSFLVDLLHPRGPACPGCLTPLATARDLEHFRQFKRVSCRACGKSFRCLTGSPFAFWPLDAPHLLALALLMAAGLEDRRLSGILGMSEQSLRLWRRKLGDSSGKTEEEFKEAALLPNVLKVFPFIRERGFKISRSLLYRHARAGKLRPRPDGYFNEDDVLSYCRRYLQYVPGFYTDQGEGVLDSLFDALIFLRKRGYKLGLSVLYKWRHEHRIGHRPNGKVTASEVLTLAEKRLKKKDSPARCCAATGAQGALI